MSNNETFWVDQLAKDLNLLVTSRGLLTDTNLSRKHLNTHAKHVQRLYELLPIAINYYSKQFFIESKDIKALREFKWAFEQFTIRDYELISLVYSRSANVFFRGRQHLLVKKRLNEYLVHQEIPALTACFALFDEALAAPSHEENSARNEAKTEFQANYNSVWTEFMIAENIEAE